MLFRPVSQSIYILKLKTDLNKIEQEEQNVLETAHGIIDQAAKVTSGEVTSTQTGMLGDEKKEDSDNEGDVANKLKGLPMRELVAICLEGLL